MLKQCATAIFGLATLLTPQEAIATDLVVPSELGALKRGFEYVYDEKYDEAEKTFSGYIQRFPDRPEGYFFMAGRWAEYINAYHNRSMLPQFEYWSDLTLKKAEAYSRAHPNDPTGHFYAGNIYGYLGLLDAQEQNLVSAFRNAVKAKDSLETALALDPKLDDALFGLGTLYYYASKKHVEEGGLVGWIVRKFITNDRDMRAEGITMLRRAAASGGITADTAFSSLMWVLITEREYDEAQQMAEEMVRRWPGDKHGYFAQGRIALLRGRCAEAKGHFENIADILKQQNVELHKFPEVEYALRLSDICVKRRQGMDHDAATEIKFLRRKLERYPNIQLEYANSKGVVRDWLEMLAQEEKATFIQKGP